MTDSTTALVHALERRRRFALLKVPGRWAVTGLTTAALAGCTSTAPAAAPSAASGASGSGSASASPASATSSPAAGSATGSTTDSGGRGSSATLPPAPSLPLTDASGPPAPPGSSAAGTVTPVVVSSGYDPGSSAVTVRAFVTGIDSGSATCTLTLTGGSASARAQAQAQPDAKTMDCGTLAVPRAQLAPGTWTGTVAYSAPSRHGTSAAFTVQVPA